MDRYPAAWSSSISIFDDKYKLGGKLCEAIRAIEQLQTAGKNQQNEDRAYEQQCGEPQGQAQANRGQLRTRTAGRVEKIHADRLARRASPPARSRLRLGFDRILDELVRHERILAPAHPLAQYIGLMVNLRNRIGESVTWYARTAEP